MARNRVSTRKDKTFCPLVCRAYLVFAPPVLQEQLEPFPPEDRLVVPAPAMTFRDLFSRVDLGLHLFIDDVHVARHLALDEGVHDREALFGVAHEPDRIVQPRVFVRRDLELATLDADALGNLFDLVDKA